MANLQQIKVSSTTYTIAHPFVTCADTASTTTKSVSFTGLDAASGTQLNIKFTNGNTASAPKLSVNSGTALNIVGFGPATPAAFSTAGSIMHLVCDGTQWNILG